MTISSGDLPVSNISSNTLLAVLPLIVPLDISSSSPARSAGLTFDSVTSIPAAFSSRVKSPIIQLLTVFGSGNAFAVSS